MKTTTLLFLAFTSAATLTSCNEKKAAIDANRNATKDAIDDRKEEVNEVAKAATQQADINAEIIKANIEAANKSAQAQLNANKVKADADAVAEKARVDALNK
jgi:hypothetical protein